MLELGRFYQQQTATKKTQQNNHVLNTQSDGIVIVEITEKPLDNEATVKAEFCNAKGTELFGVDLTGENCERAFEAPRFASYDMEADSRRVQQHQEEHGNDHRQGLLSLKEIMVKPKNAGCENMSNEEKQTEAYVMRPEIQDDFRPDDAQEDASEDRTIIVERMELIFNEKDC